MILLYTKIGEAWTSFCCITNYFVPYLGIPAKLYFLSNGVHSGVCSVLSRVAPCSNPSLSAGLPARKIFNISPSHQLHFIGEEEIKRRISLRTSLFITVPNILLFLTDNSGMKLQYGLIAIIHSDTIDCMVVIIHSAAISWLLPFTAPWLTVFYHSQHHDWLVAIIHSAMIYWLL